jgi:hypothetical protein
MKFLCSNCKAKYQIADEKVTGRTLRMTCRQCKQEIVIRGEAPARGSQVHAGQIHANQAHTTPPSSSVAGMPAPVPHAAAPPSPLAIDFQRQVGGGVRASLAPPPPLLDAWHVAINEVPVGPMRREDVARRIAAGAVTSESLAWREGLDDWLPVRQIPELAALLGMQAPPPVAFVPAMPAQRVDMAPIGGRAGAAPAFSLDDWAPPGPDASSAHALRGSPLADVDSSRGGRSPQWGLMFVGLCVFAFLMSAMTIFGARFLSRTEPAATAPAAATVTGTTTAPSAEPAEARVSPPSEAETQEMVIELDEVGLDSPTRPRTTGANGAKATPTTATTAKSKGKPDLTDAEKAMLARMGGGAEPAISGIGSKTTTTRSTGAGPSGGLTADQLSKVVMQGRKNLQRCYETALRGSGSDETIRLDVEITVSPAGNVTAVKTGGSELPGMKDCVQRTVKMWRFPSSGDSTQTKFPLVFQPGG